MVTNIHLLVLRLRGAKLLSVATLQLPLRLGGQELGDGGIVVREVRRNWGTEGLEFVFHRAQSE